MKNITTFLITALFIIAAFAGIVLFMSVENLIISILIMAVIVAIIIFTSRNNSIRDILQTSFKKQRSGLTALSALLVLALPFLFLKNHYVIHIFTLSLIYIVATLGLNFQVGSANMVNFAQGAFFGIGAYTSALITVNLGLSFWIGFPAAILVAGFFGTLMGVPTLKTKEFHLSLVTIAFAYVAYLLILNMQWTGGADGVAGVPKPKFFGLTIFKTVRFGSLRISSTFFYYYFALFFVFIGIIVARILRNSWLGLGWNAIREDEISSRCYGMNINSLKLLSFFIGSMYAGASGALYSHFAGFISTESMAFSVGLLMVCMVILGGMDNIIGVVLGTALLVLIPEKFRAFQDFRLLFYGVILILMLRFRPQGLIPKTLRNYHTMRGAR